MCLGPLRRPLRSALCPLTHWAVGPASALSLFSKKDQPKAFFRGYFGAMSRLGEGKGHNDFIDDSCFVLL